MSWLKRYGVIFLFVVIVAIAFRVPVLDQRPMHGDEAIHAHKLGDLIEKNLYIYDPFEYHGPTLNYFTLIPAWLGGESSFAELSEFTCRIVPVFFGILLVMMPLLLIKGLGRTTAIFAAILTAVSPMMVFYSRYYIQEMLLVCFTFGVIVGGYRYTQNAKARWALLTGVCLGLMHATKETCIIAYGAMFVAILSILVTNSKAKERALEFKKNLNYGHVAVMIVSAAAVSVLFFSSFFSNPEGILDSIRTYTTYFDRAGESIHVHPWYYYLETLIYSRHGKGPAWSEGFVLVLALAGFIVSMTNRKILDASDSLLGFIARYTLIMTVIYCAIPYKTPWSMLGFYHGMILLAGVGVAFFLRISTTFWRKAAVGTILTISILALVGQAFLGNFYFHSDPGNPYVYAHPTTDVFDITERIEDISRVHPDGKDMYVEFICPGGDYWPFPWYLRQFSKVAFRTAVDVNQPSAPLIIALPEVQQELIEKLYELPPPGKRHMYKYLFDSTKYLRPNVELQCYIRSDLWNDYVQMEARKK